MWTSRTFQTWRTIGVVVVGGVALAATGRGTARADKILLRGGGEIRGELLDPLEKSANVRVLTANSARPLSFARDQIVKVEAEASVLDDYLARKAALVETAQAQYDFGAWCESAGLAGLSRPHYQRAVELDPNFAPAQKKLGRVLHEGRWLSYEELRTAEGLVLRDGRWVPMEAGPDAAARSEAKSAHQEWVRRIRVILQLLRSAPAEERQEAERRLAEIRDPAALPALFEVFAPEEPAYRALLLRLLETFPGPEARETLVRYALGETEATLWDQAVELLHARKDPETIVSLVRAIDGRDMARDGRAARALARLEARSSVPRLVDALVRSEMRWVAVPAQRRPVGPGASSGTPAFTSVVGQNYVANVEPVVGPGVVAFRPVIGTVGTGVALGSGGSQPAPPVPMIPRPVRVSTPNPEVRDALVALTGRDFGYNTSAWKRWLRSSFRLEAEPGRRVVEP